MVVTLIALSVFVISFVLLGSLYLMLISFNAIKKKRLEKIARLVAIYSLFITLVYIFQHIFM